MVKIMINIKDVDVTIGSWKISMLLYFPCQEVGDTCVILSWESIGIVPPGLIEYVITASFLFGCHTPGVASRRRKSHDILCIDRCHKAKDKERYDTYYGDHEYHNTLVDGKGESEQSLVVNERQIEYVLGLYAKNDVETIKKLTNLAQVDNLRLHQTINTHTFLMNGPNYHFKSSYRNNQSVVSNERAQIIETLQDMLNKHSNQAYARIAALKSFDEKGHGLYDVTGRHMQGVYAIIDQNGNVGMSNEPNNKIAGSHSPPDSGRIRTDIVSGSMYSYVLAVPEHNTIEEKAFIANDNLLNQTDESREAIANANNKKQALLDYAVSDEAAAITTGSNSLYDEGIRIDDVRLWFLAFSFTVLVWLLCCLLLLLCSISGCFCGFKLVWHPQQRMYYDHGKYHSHEVLGLEEREAGVAVLTTTHSNKRNMIKVYQIHLIRYKQKKKKTYCDYCDPICNIIAGLTATGTNNNETKLGTEILIPIDNCFKSGERKRI